MNFSEYPPHPLLRSIIECYWIAEGNSIEINKIIPDAFSEMIFHFGDVYQIQQIDKTWVNQPLSILAGQLTKPIYIRPTGKTGVLGVKFKPLGIWKLFSCSMSALENQTVSLRDFINLDSKTIIDSLRTTATDTKRIEIVNTVFLSKLTSSRTTFVEHIMEKIQQTQGAAAIATLCEEENISLRKLERIFREAIGISPKRYSRLVRFTHVFKLLHQKSIDRTEATYLCGYFDQSHFNRDFKIFSGEDPKSYFNADHVFANFFLNR